MFALPLMLGLFAPAADPAPKSAKDAFQPLNALIGSWKGTGYPTGIPGGNQPGSWAETITWAWKFKGQDAWLEANFEKGKHFTRGELRYLPDSDSFKLVLTAPDKSTTTYAGKIDLGKAKVPAPVLTLDRTDGGLKQDERFVLSLLHANRYLYRFETKPKGATGYEKQYMVGATKEGEAFATANTGPECIVTGGKGTIAVSFKGKTYYVCCSGCKEAFNDEPEKFIAELAKKK